MIIKIYDDCITNEADNDIIINLHKDFTIDNFIADWNNWIKSNIKEEKQNEYYLTFKK